MTRESAYDTDKHTEERVLNLIQELDANITEICWDEVRKVLFAEGITEDLMDPETYQDQSSYKEWEVMRPYVLSLIKRLGALYSYEITAKPY